MVPKVIAECCQFIGSGGNNIELCCSVATFVKHSLLFKMTFYILLCPFILYLWSSLCRFGVSVRVFLLISR